MPALILSGRYIPAACRLASAQFMPGRDGQAQQNLFFQHIQYIQMLIRQNAVGLFFLIG